MLADLRYAIRTLVRAPGFAITAILALALGIGANTTIFSAVNSILFHPAGVSEPQRIVALRVRYGDMQMANIGNSVMDFKDAREQTSVFSAVAVTSDGSFNYATPDAPVRLEGAQVSYRWFDVFGARPMIGRVFAEEEDQPDANHVVVLSYGTWRHFFGGDRSVVDRTIELNQLPYRVIGVMPPEFHFPARAEVWVPLGIKPSAFVADNRHNQFLDMYARLQPGVSFERAQIATKAIVDRVLQTEDSKGYGKASKWALFAMPYLEFTSGDLRGPMYVLLGAVGFVLLIACSNIAGLLLARASGRAREVAVRAALGAGRWRLVRQMLVESGVLAFAGGLLGIAAGYSGIRLLMALAPQSIAQGLVVSLDQRVMLFAIGVTVAAGLAFGIAPAWQLATASGITGLREGGRSGTASRSRQRTRSLLVMAELAIALVLLAGAGLFLRSLTRLQMVDTGFDPRRVSSAHASLVSSRYKDQAQRSQFIRTTVDRLSTMPGIESAAAIIPLPFSDPSWGASFSIEGRAQLPDEPGPHGNVRYISPNYFSTMGIRIVSGRAFTGQDISPESPVAIIDELLAAQYWPNQNPVGAHMRFGSRQPWATIVGVVGAVRHTELAGVSKKGTYYFPIYEKTPDVVSFVVRGPQGNQAIRAAVGAVDSLEPVYDVKPMEERVAESLGPRRFAVTLLGGFALIALLMAAIGIYGVISYGVTLRTHEIGIRMALGAERAQVMRLVLLQALRLAAAGVAVGLVGSAILGRLVSTQLYQTSRFDPATFAATTGVLLGAALLASYLPARRAMKVDPMIALRYE